MSELKIKAAKKAVEYVKDGMILGLGTGSTTKFAVDEIGKLVAAGYDLVGIPTSIETEKQAKSLNIPLTELECVDKIDLTIDGADEVDPNFDLIKGLGGALLREKIVAYYSKKEIIIIDESKIVNQLGTRVSLPVEVTKFSHKKTKESIEKLGCSAQLRGSDSPFVTDNGNFIYDCKFSGISDPHGLELKLNSIPGVVENGLFLDLASHVVIGTESETRVLEKKAY